MTKFIEIFFKICVLLDIYNENCQEKKIYDLLWCNMIMKEKYFFSDVWNKLLTWYAIFLTVALEVNVTKENGS